MLVHHQPVTDAHLLTLAWEHKVRLTTFDRGIERLIPSDFSAGEVLEVLIP